MLSTPPEVATATRGGEANGPTECTSPSNSGAPMGSSSAHFMAIEAPYSHPAFCHSVWLCTLILSAESGNFSPERRRRD